MKISIEATPQEIAELLQAITSSQEQKNNITIDGRKVFASKKVLDEDHDNKLNQIDELINSNLSLFSKRIPADLEQTKSLAWLLLARKLAHY
ncbi:MAG: hypothetical protein ACFWTP_11790 [Enterococcus gilvus]|jgi:hypothetical protein|uniref:hypothetical protein n=1 Tax=Enterococcus gilvus TaxID=160453 RepID=UPI001F075A0B|nr:hypothetical protein [Enterococcus gilvus]